MDPRTFPTLVLSKEGGLILLAQDDNEDGSFVGTVMAGGNAEMPFGTRMNARLDAFEPFAGTLTIPA